MTQPLIGQVARIDNHHEGYVSPEDFAEIAQILHRNSNRYGRSQIGSGLALLQGLVRCERCGRAMNVWYPRNLRQSGFYQLRCPGQYAEGGLQCISTPGLPLQRRVVEAALARIAPLRIRDVRAEWEIARKSDRLKGARERVAVRLAEQRLEKAKRLYLDCDPSRAEVRNVLEQELEEAGKKLARLKGELGTDEPEQQFSEQSWAALERLCADVRAIWNAPTTAFRDRKEVLRILIDAVVIRSHTRDATVGYVRWSDGGDECGIEILRPQRLHREIWAMHLEGILPNVIADRLNERGCRTQQDNPWTFTTVQRTIALRKRQGG